MSLIVRPRLCLHLDDWLRIHHVLGRLHVVLGLLAPFEALEVVLSQLSLLRGHGLVPLLLHHESHLLGLCHLLPRLHRRWHLRFRRVALLASTFQQVLLSLRPGDPRPLSFHLNSIFAIRPVRRLALLLLVHDLLHPILIVLRGHHVAASVLEHLRTHILKLVQLPFFRCFKNGSIIIINPIQIP